MEVLFVLIPASLGVSLFFLLAFIWAVKAGQFNDLKKPAYQLLYEDLDSCKELEQKAKQ